MILKILKNAHLILFFCLIQLPCFAQKNVSNTIIDNQINSSNEGWFSLGTRNTMSLFSDDGSGLGTGGNFRVQLSNSVNTDWFADYIVVNIDNKVRSEYIHIGWSAIYYPFERLQYPNHKLQPYVMAGHCFDYNKKTILANRYSKDRWGSAVQAGIGTHFNLTEKFDVTFTAQYMIHLTKDLDLLKSEDKIFIVEKSGSAIEGHLLTSVGINYKIFKLWNK